MKLKIKITIEMKKLIVIIFAICLCFCTISCTEEFHGESGYVTSVKYKERGGKYLYKVHVRHLLTYHSGYILYTNHLYQVGDTIVIAGRNYR